MYFKALPDIILLELWKKRNSLKHERKDVTEQRLIFNITRNMRMLPKVRKLKLEFSYNWPGILKDFEQLKPTVKVTTVLWKFPMKEWVKYNADGASRENPGNSSFAFCLRDIHYDSLYAKGSIIEDTNNMEAEEIAILQKTKHCSHTIHDKVIIQMNSLSMQKILNREWDSP